MDNDNSKFSIWIIGLLALCCALPLLLLSGGSVAFLTGLFTNNITLIIAAFVLVMVASWLFFRRKK